MQPSDEKVQEVAAWAVHSSNCFNCPECGGIDHVDSTTASEVLTAVTPLILASGKSQADAVAEMLDRHREETGRLQSRLHELVRRMPIFQAKAPTSELETARRMARRRAESEAHLMNVIDFIQETLRRYAATQDGQLKAELLAFIAEVDRRAQNRGK